MANYNVPSTPDVPGGTAHQGEQRPAHASDGQWPANFEINPAGSVPLNVDWQVDILPGGARIAGNGGGMALDRRIRGMAQHDTSAPTDNVFNVPHAPADRQIGQRLPASPQSGR